MLSVSNLSVQYGKRVLFDQVNVSFTPGNCYGIIGANGAGKSTFLKIISGEQEANSGNVFLEPGKRLSVLEQNHNAYDQFSVLDSVLRGNKVFYDIKSEMDLLYAKEDFSEEDGERVGLLQVKFEEMNGWNADSEAASLLSNLEIPEALHFTKMSELDGKQKVRVLLAQALFGNPDVLIMDEPTAGLDPNQVLEVRKTIKGLGKTILLSTHILQEVPEVADRIILINHGRLIFEGTPEELKSESSLDSWFNRQTMEAA